MRQIERESGRESYPEREALSRSIPSLSVRPSQITLKNVKKQFVASLQAREAFKGFPER